ncbi:MAG: hypothetical protein ACRDHD_06665 [Candidatus Limnocylindria bacterium]
MRRGRIAAESDMFQVHDPLALRLHAQAQREALRATMAASRAGNARRRDGGWLLNAGERLAPEAAQRLRPAADCQ